MTSKCKRYCTEVKSVNVTFEWEIKRFDLLHHKNQEPLKSPKFYDGKDEVAWSLELYPRGHEKNTPDFISLFLCLESEGSASFPIRTKVSLSILQSDTPINSVDFVNDYTKELKGYGVPRFYERPILFNRCKPSNSFLIRCRLERVLTIVTEPACTLDFNSNDHQLEDYCRQLFLKSDQLSDVSIVVGDESFPAHKLLLAARSSVFAAMFTHKDLKENLTNEVEIKDFEPEVIRGVLQFIYTDQVENLSEIAGELIRAAHKYEIESLKAMCEKALCESLDVQNAIEMLNLADLYKCRKLIEYTIDFISEHFDKVVESEGYTQIENFQHFKKLMGLLLKKEKKT